MVDLMEDEKKYDKSALIRAQVHYFNNKKFQQEVLSQRILLVYLNREPSFVTIPINLYQRIEKLMELISVLANYNELSRQMDRSNDPKKKKSLREIISKLEVDFRAIEQALLQDASDAMSTVKF